MNKKGWIRIIEALIAVLLIAGVALITVNKGEFQREDISSRVHDAEIGILREIQLNNTLRDEILKIKIVPIKWGDFPPDVKTKIESSIPSYLECAGRICNPSDSCFLDETPNNNVYAESIIISSNLETFNPRLLKLFCWTEA